MHRQDSPYPQRQEPSWGETEDLHLKTSYMPGSEIGVDSPMCVYESDGRRLDVDLREALRLIRVRALRHAKHPVLGTSSC